MTVKIITDSLGDIPSNVAKKLGITVIPINVIFGTEVFRDGVDLTTEQFYDKLIRSKIFPATTIPPLSTYIELFNKAAKETDEILVITISSKLSNTYEASLQTVELMERKCRVEVIDSQWAVMAQGLIVISAAKAAQTGAGLDEVVDITQRNILRTEVRMVFDTLEYLKRGGRIGKAQTFVGSMLRLHPILGVRDGEVYPFTRERSRAKATDYLYNFAVSFSHIEAIAVEDATTPDEADRLVERLGSKFPKEHIYRSKISPVIGAHVGPHVLAVSVLGDK
ncbi:MAG TPA: DegV family protein [Dehalococcoidales bacterium]|nr:DegV family protein [Dehalococcoidales bacterium]